jgi:hypothetical protein
MGEERSVLVLRGYEEHRPEEKHVLDSKYDHTEQGNVLVLRA